jgi:Tfp pilus assembly protein PilZ
VQEEEDLGGVGVALREGEDVEVVVADVEVLLGSVTRCNVCCGS